MKTHIDLFSGIGGFALSARWVGIKTIQFVENDPFCQKVLQKNFKGVPIHGDIKTFSIKTFADTELHGLPTSHAKIKKTKSQIEKKSDGVRKPARGTDLPDGRPFLITGGLPCQPFSVAGKRKGTADDRHLWKEMFRVIKEFKPTWVIAENVVGIKSMELVNSDSALESETDYNEDGENSFTSILDGVCKDLESIGFETQSIIIPACAIDNCPHRRDRVWIIAYSAESGVRLEDKKIADKEQRASEDRGESIRSEDRQTGTSGTESADRNDGRNSTPHPQSIRDRRGIYHQRGTGERKLPQEKQEGCEVGGEGKRRTGINAHPNSEHDGRFETKTNRKYNEAKPETESRTQLSQHEPARNIGVSRFGKNACANNTNTQSKRLERGIKTNQEEGQKSDDEQLHGCCGKWDEPWITVASRLCHLDDGLSSGLVGYHGITEEHLKHRNKYRIQKLKALGNAIVPQVCYQILLAIMEASENL